MLKLDIEGAECDVILNLIENNLLPDQILVEFDELYTYDLKQLRKYLRLHNKLTKKKLFISKNTTFFKSTLYKKRMSKKIALITGITGQDGAYLADLLLKKI